MQFVTMLDGAKICPSSSACVVVLFSRAESGSKVLELMIAKDISFLKQQSDYYTNRPHRVESHVLSESF